MRNFDEVHSKESKQIDDDELINLVLNESKAEQKYARKKIIENIKEGIIIILTMIITFVVTVTVFFYFYNG